VGGEKELGFSLRERVVSSDGRGLPAEIVIEKKKG